MPSDIVRKFPDVDIKHLYDDSIINKPNSFASVLYNAMIHPIKNFTYKGVIWYQGESNRNNPVLYKDLFITFVNELRILLENKNLPFYYTQIAPYSYGDSNGLNGTLIREVQYESEKLIPNVGMAVLMDIGDENCIHPAEKEKVGERLAYLALNHTYKIESIPSDAPRYSSFELKDNSVIVSFDIAPLGITSYGKPLQLFEIAGEDGVFYKAEAQIVARSKVKIWSEKVNNPYEVRYAFKNFVIGDLFGVNGIPVSSFRFKLK